MYSQAFSAAGTAARLAVHARAPTSDVCPNERTPELPMKTLQRDDDSDLDDVRL